MENGIEPIRNAIHEFSKELIVITGLTIIGIFRKRLQGLSAFLINRFSTRRATFNQTEKQLLLETVEAIKNQLHPNGGASIRDAVNRIDKKLTHMDETMKTVCSSTELITDTLNMCRWSADKHGKVTFVSRSYKKLLGIVDDDVCMGDAWQGRIFVDDREKAVEEWDRSKQARSEFDHVFRVKRSESDNTLVRVHAHARPIFSETKEVRGWVGILTPIAEEK